MNSNIRKNIVMTVLSVYITLFIANIFFDRVLGILLSINTAGAVRYVDSRDRYQVVRDMREEGRDAYPIAVPVHLIERVSREWVDDENKLIPLGGIANVTTVYCNENDYYTYYHCCPVNRNKKGLNPNELLQYKCDQTL